MLRRFLIAAPLAVLVAPTPARAHTTPRGLGGLGSDAVDGAFPRTVRHVSGETVIPAPPLRIAAIATGQLDGLLSLGLVPAGVARVEDGELVSPYLHARFAPLLQASIADLGTRVAPDIEAVAQLRPDLILMNGAVPRPELYARFSQIAPTVVTRGTGVNWKADFLLLADAAGCRQMAQAILDRFHADADVVVGRFPDPGAAPSVSFLLAAGGRNRVMGVPSFAGGIAEDMGLRRPPGQRFDATSRDISLEVLDEADADWMFCAARGGGLGALPRAPLWPTLDAVRAGRAVTVDADPFFLNAGPAAARIVLDTVAARVAPSG